MASSASEQVGRGPLGDQGARVRPRSRDRGSVLIEVAVAIPMALALAAALAWLVGLVAVKNEALERAHAIAGQVARGVPPQVLSTTEGFRVDIDTGPDLVRVTVSRTMAGPAPILDGLTTSISATAVAAPEPAW